MGVCVKQHETQSSDNKPVLLLLVSEGKYFISHRLSLAMTAKKAGYRIVVCTKKSSELESLEDEIKFIDVPFQRSLGGFFEELYVLKRIWCCVNQVRPTIVHAVSLKISILAALCLWRRKGSTLLCAFTGFGHLFTSNRVRARMLKLVVQFLLKNLLANKRFWSVVQNKDDLGLLKEIRCGRDDRLMLVKGSGVNIDFFSFSTLAPKKIKKILFPARLLVDKGIFEFVEAARLVSATRSDVEFILAGRLDDSNPSTVSPQEVESWHTEGVVKWVGEVTDMRPLYEESYIVCLPSHREGLPKSLLEAASVGRPIVATDVPGCREICRHRQNGLLVPIKDASKLAFSLEVLLNDFELCTQFGLRGRTIVEKEFSDVRINELFLEIYERMRII